MPATLAAAELFGAAKGAFTGSERARDGYFRRAHGGTLFLDEIGEAPAELQVTLLRALETGEIFPVGSSAPVRVDVRVLAATDADLEERTRQGAFRAPLLHRLAGYEIWLPPLRERRDDLGRLLLEFLRQELEPLGELHRLDPDHPGQVCHREHGGDLGTMAERLEVSRPALRRRLRDLGLSIRSSPTEQEVSGRARPVIPEALSSVESCNCFGREDKNEMKSCLIGEYQRSSTYGGCGC